MDRLSRFSISFSSSSKRSMITTTTATTQARKLIRQGRLRNPQICCGHQTQQQVQDHESISFRCNSKKEVRWASSTVDNELTPKKSFQKEPYFSQTFEVNRDTYMGLTAGSMQMKLVRRV